MEPIKINIEISLKEDTISQIGQAIYHALAVAVNIVDDIKVKDEPADTGTNTVQEVAKSATTKAQESPAPAEPCKAAEEPEREYTDDVMKDVTHAAVQRLREKGMSTAFIRTDIFSKYSCSNSTGCPQEHRAELYAELDQLAR